MAELLAAERTTSVPHIDRLGPFVVKSSDLLVPVLSNSV
jgi:hypothetical protein